MANIRIMWDNAAERANISASTNAGNLLGSSLNTNTKSLAHRSSGNSVVYTLTWTTNEQINGVILPATNLSSLATIRVFTGEYDSTAVLACPNTLLDGYPGQKNVNSFPYGGISKTAIWFPNIVTTTSLIITLNDPSKTSLGNPAYPNYIDCSRIICGKYWEPSLNVSRNSLSLTIEDTTQTTRSDAGDLIADRGTINERLSFNFDLLTKTDKEELVKILKYVGTYKNLAISVIPESNSRNEQDYIIYGKKDVNSIDYVVHNFYSSSFSITGW